MRLWTRFINSTANMIFFQTREPYTYPSSSVEKPKYYSGGYTSPVATSFPPRFVWFRPYRAAQLYIQRSGSFPLQIRSIRSLHDDWIEETQGGRANKYSFGDATSEFRPRAVRQTRNHERWSNGTLGPTFGRGLYYPRDDPSIYGSSGASIC